MWSPVTSWIVRLLSLGLGGLFIFAGLQKHLSPYEFTEAILAYELLSPSGAALTAAFFPWLEIVAGAVVALGALLPQGADSRSLAAMGHLRRGALLLLVLLTALFVVLLVVTMARGLKIACGCGLFFQRLVGPAALAEDLALLALAAWLYRRAH
jgi:hypothetical protein